MNNAQLFFSIEVKKIQFDKWIEGIRRNCDPGNDFVMEWVKQNAEKFRKTWDDSKCKFCIKCIDCGYNVLSACEHFIEN